MIFKNSSSHPIAIVLGVVSFLGTAILAHSNDQDPSQEMPRYFSIEQSGLNFNASVGFFGGPAILQARLNAPVIKSLSRDIATFDLVSSDELELDCLFCLDSLAEQDELILTHCKHLFCKRCFQEWQKYHSKSEPLDCPLCRTPNCQKNLLTLIKNGKSDYDVSLAEGQFSPLELTELNTPTGMTFTRAPDQFLLQPDRLLTGGWTLPSRRTWWGGLKKGITWYTQVIPLNTNTPDFLFNQVDATLLCKDDRHPEFGLPTPEEFKRLQTTMGFRSNSNLKRQAALFFREFFVPSDGPFWLSGNGAENPFIFTPDGLIRRASSTTDAFQVICVKR